MKAARVAGDVVDLGDTAKTSESNRNPGGQMVRMMIMMVMMMLLMTILITMMMKKMTD